MSFDMLISALHKLTTSSTGILFAVPIPAEFAVCETQLELCITAAIKEAE